MSYRRAPLSRRLPLGYSVSRERYPLSRLNRHRRALSYVRKNLRRSSPNLPRSHSLSLETPCSLNLETPRSRNLGNSTTILTYWFTRTSTSTTTLPHPRFPRKNGNPSSGCSACSVGLSVDSPSLFFLSLLCPPLCSSYLTFADRVVLLAHSYL